MNIQEYCDALNLELTLTYYPNQGDRWCAKIAGCEFKTAKTSHILSALYGTGTSPRAAICDYLEQIRGMLMIIDAADPAKRREYTVPMGLKATPQ